MERQVSDIPEWLYIMFIWACGSFGSLALFLVAAAIFFIGILNKKLPVRARNIGLAAFFSPIVWVALGSGESRWQDLVYYVLRYCVVISLGSAMGITIYSIFKVGLPFAEKTFAMMFVGLWLSLFLLRLFASIYYGFQPRWD
jgi:hypothetical protein